MAKRSKRNAPARLPEGILRNLGPAALDTMGGIGDTAVGHFGTLMRTLGSDNDLWTAAEQNRAKAREAAYRRGGLQGALQDVGGAAAFALPALLASRGAGMVGGLKMPKSLAKIKTVKGLTKWVKNHKTLAKALGWGAGLGIGGALLSRSGEDAALEQVKNPAVAPGPDAAGQGLGQPAGGDPTTDPMAVYNMLRGQDDGSQAMVQGLMAEAQRRAQGPQGNGLGWGWELGGPGGYTPRSAGEFAQRFHGSRGSQNRERERLMNMAIAERSWADAPMMAAAGIAQQQAPAGLQGQLQRVQMQLAAQPMNQKYKEAQVGLSLQKLQQDALNNQRTGAVKTVSEMVKQGVPFPEIQRNNPELYNLAYGLSGT